MGDVVHQPVGVACRDEQGLAWLENQDRGPAGTVEQDVDPSPGSRANHGSVAKLLGVCVRRRPGPFPEGPGRPARRDVPHGHRVNQDRNVLVVVQNFRLVGARQ